MSKQLKKIQAMPPYPWQNRAWDEITSMALKGKLPHAMLLQGDDGLDDFAISMSRYLLCRAPADKLACGRCKDCELFLAGSHPDFHFTGLEEKSVQIKVDQIRSLTNFVAKTAQREKRKVVVIDPASAMNLNAANALLKCLEEPSGDTVLLLVQQSQKILLPTIRSRCSVVKVPAPDANTAIAWLQSKGIESPQEALSYSQNSPILAWQLSRDGNLANWQKVHQQLDRLVQQGVTPQQLAATWKVMTASEVVQIILSWVEEKIRFAFASEANKQSILTLYYCHDTLSKNKQRLNAGLNLNPQMLFEELAIELQRCSHLPLKCL